MRLLQCDLFVAVQLFLLPLVLTNEESDLKAEGARPRRFCLINSASNDTAENEKLALQKASTRIEGIYTKQQYETRPTRVLIHGWVSWFTEGSGGGGGDGGGGAGEFTAIADAYRKFHPDRFNLVTVLWNADPLNYLYAQKYAKSTVAVLVAKFLDDRLGSNVKAWKDLKIIGHSLGAHIAGFVGKNVKKGKVGTIIGLDPAGPSYGDNPPKNRLAKTDAAYTECIMTDTCYGINTAICEVNFYPNSGWSQPGCDGNDCDHSRSHQFFADSISHNNYMAKKCTGPLSRNIQRSCAEGTVYMGGEPGNMERRISPGIYYLATGENWPYGKGPVQKDSSYCNF